MNKNKPTPINPTLYSVSISPLVFPDVREVRAEYARLRAIASKRLNRLASAGYEKSKSYKNYVDVLKPLPKNAGEGQARRALADVARFLSLKTSTVTGQKIARDKQLKKMHEEGYDFLNSSNIDLFRDYMEIVMGYKKSQDYDSESIVELFKTAEELKVNPLTIADDFQDYLDQDENVILPKLKELSEEDQEALKSMESDELKEPLPVEITDQRQKTEQKRKTSAAQKRANKMKEQAAKMRRNAARRPKSRKRGR